ncbi:MAG: carbohydrate ABC transporter permease, partial [Nocardioidaceae bacterium]
MATIPAPGRTVTRRPSPMARRQARAAWMLALPFVLLFVVFTAWPVLSSLMMSFTDLRSTDVQTPFAVEPIGFENYTRLLSDPLFHTVAVNTAFYVIGGVPLTMGLALAAAVGLNGIRRLRGFFRTGYYAPVVSSIVAVAVVWRFLLQPESGLIDRLLGLVGLSGVDWLNSTTWALPTLIVMAAWRNLGFLMVI